MPGAPYFITTCLEGSIPARGLLEMERYRGEQISRLKPDPPGKVLAWKKLFAQRERWLDEEPACRWLESPELARIAVDALFHYHCLHRAQPREGRPRRLPRSMALLLCPPSPRPPNPLRPSPSSSNRGAEIPS